MYVSNVSFHTTAEDLKALFAEFGEVLSAKLISDKVTGRPRGFGFVEMANEEQATTAMASLNNKQIEGRPLSVSVAKEKTGGGSFNRGTTRTW